MRNLPVRRTAVAAFATVMLTSGCGAFGDEMSGGNGDGHMTVALQFTPRAGHALETDDAFVLTQVGCLETLLTYDFEAGELEPLLATEWEQTEPTAWDFTLREGVKFQDGTDLTADAVVTALTHVLETEVPPRPFTPEAIESVTAVDESTVRITTPKPSALVPYRVAAVNTGILAEKAYGGRTVDVEGTCTGPFTIESETPQQSMDLVRNDDWWGGDIALESVTAKFLPDGAARAAQIRTGESQVALGLPSTAVGELESDSSVTVTAEATPRTTGLYLNHARPPFDDPDVRKAIQLTIDAQAISDSIYNGTVVPASGPFPEGAPWAPEGVEPVTPDVEQAKQLLADAGYEPGEIQVELLAYTERPEFADLAAIIQEQLKQIGIEVEVKVSDYAGIEPSLLDHTYDMSLLSRNHLTDIADPIGFLEADYTCNGGYNITAFCDPAFDERLAEANAEGDAEARYEIYAELAQRLQEEATTVFLVAEQTIAAHRNEVANFVDDPLARYAVTPDLSFSN